MKIYNKNIEKVRGKIEELSNKVKDENLDSIGRSIDFQKDDKDWLQEKVRNNPEDFVEKNIAVFNEKILGISEKFSDLFFTLKYDYNLDTQLILIAKVFRTEERKDKAEENIGMPICNVIIEDKEDNKDN